MGRVGNFTVITSLGWEDTSTAVLLRPQAFSYEAGWNKPSDSGNHELRIDVKWGNKIIS